MQLLTRPFLAVVVLSSALLVARATRADEFATNGTFDRDVAGWTPASTSLVTSWSPLDASGLASSGSLLVSNEAPNGLNAGVRQCIDGLQPGLALSARARVRIPSGGASGQAGVQFFFTSGRGCSGPIIGNVDVQTTVTLDSWESMAFPVTPVPAGAGSTVVILQVIKSLPDSKAFRAYFDDVHVSTPSLAMLTVPASASVHGQNGAFFHTDLWVMNPSRTTAIGVTARHRCFAGQACAGAAKSFTLLPQQTRQFQDVLASLFGDPESSGAIELTYDAAAGTIAATSRTYTPSLPAPTNGTAIPALAASSAVEGALFLGLGNNGGDRTAGFRSNAGVYNPGPGSVTVTFDLLKAGGTAFGSFERTCGPNEAFQVNDVFSEAGAGAAVTTSATLSVHATAPVFAYVTVIDNQSGDTSWPLPFPGSTH